MLHLVSQKLDAFRSHMRHEAFVSVLMPDQVAGLVAGLVAVEATYGYSLSG